MKILFIEDNPEFASYAKSILEANGHSVDHISKADDLIPKLEKLDYNLVVLDIMLRRGKIVEKGSYPDMGIALYKKIREKNKQIKIIVLSARSKSEIWSYFETDLNVKYHSKPIYSDTTKFLTLINYFQE
jgi:DNA-binding response OmpR family regulator